MPKLTVDGIEVEVPAGATVLQACEVAGKEIPRFCYHERLSIAGNCRMCLVEQEKAPKPIASCAMPAADGMVIHTNTPKVKKAREGVMEFLLINHPLDCPICDQGGECDLQDEAMAYGRGFSRYDENKRAVTEKYMGPLIKTQMTRCIHCTRCVRFAEEVAGVEEIGAIYRGENMQITTYLEKAVTSELSANVIDLCPVGALTSKPYAFSARPWELSKNESIDVMDAVGSNIRVDARANEVMRVLPRLNEEVNEEWISDKTRYAVDGLIRRRLDRPWVRVDGKLREASWQDAFQAIKSGLSGLEGNQIAGLAGDLAEVEALVALKDLLNKLGSTTLECRLDGAMIDPSVRSSYLFNSTISGAEVADFILMIGTNPRIEAPLINTRIRKAVRKQGAKAFNLGPAAELGYPVEQLGDDLSILKGIASGAHPLAESLKNAQRPMIVVGMGALARADGAAVLSAARSIADKFGLVKDGWNGFNVLHTAAGRVGALDIGFVTDGGLEGIRSKVAEGAIKAVFLAGVDEIDTSFLKDTFTIYIGTHGDEGVRHADVILPGAAYTEKSGTWVNTEGRVQRGIRAVFPPGDAREDWTILRALSDVLGQRLPYDSIVQLRERMAEVAPHLGQLGITPAAWGDFGVAGGISSAPVALPITNFYQTNPIARASDTMAACVREILGEQTQATGTHG
ncbi:NADH-quinone oxidoreductase subunit NuoG [Pedomonas mirosovicensis]|uniref:NADH-quinone oxidoreductase subunit NuoG n=1 Tax=Pedomonas mirosovicensis TaxID=2908641 RepID=UPI00216812ED|nr:NADH-quinone oxidoreductase subunit NuoG [Pedomonas mirosovicensis]MCH8685351.1 NADH-quinone oxidoreductase subunit NuoG [Pedomonas mirosovicensis]